MKLKQHRILIFGVLFGAVVSPKILSNSWKFINEIPIVWSSFLFGAFLAVLILLLMFVVKIYVINTLTEKNSPDKIDITFGLLNSMFPSLTQSEFTNLQLVVKGYLEKFLIVRFYRNFLALLTAVAISVTAVAGTVLLIEQNNRLRDQNELIESQTQLTLLDLTAKLRSQLEIPRKVMEINNTYDLTDMNNRECSIEVDATKNYYSSPNRSTVLSMSNTISNSRLKSELVDAIQNLVHDDSPSVALGAILVLDEIGVAPEKNAIVLENINISNVDLKSSFGLKILNSYIDGFQCDQCALTIESSHIANLDFTRSLRMTGNVLNAEYCLGADLAENSVIENNLIVGDKIYLGGPFGQFGPFSPKSCLQIGSRKNYHITRSVDRSTVLSDSGIGDVKQLAALFYGGSLTPRYLGIDDYSSVASLTKKFIFPGDRAGPDRLPFPANIRGEEYIPPMGLSDVTHVPCGLSKQICRGLPNVTCH